MAITRSQQAKQLLANGGRIGFKGGADASMADFGTPSTSGISAGKEGPGPAVGAGGASFNSSDNFQTLSSIDEGARRRNQIDLDNAAIKKGEDALKKLYDEGVPKSNMPGILGLGLNATKKLRDFTLKKNIEYFEDLSTLKYPKTAQGYKDYMSDRLAGKIDAAGNTIMSGDNDDNMFLPVDTTFNMASSDMDQGTDTTEEDEGLRLAFRADGGRIGAQQGGIMPRLNQLGGGVSSAEQMLQDINQRLESAESSLGSGGGQATFELAGGNTTTQPPMNLGQLPVSRGGPGPDQLESLFRSQIGNGIYDMNRGNQLNVTPPQTPVAMQQPMSGIPAASYANGGNVVGGEYDFETARQMYGLGKLVKKATRAVKKIAKSPIGKAALIAGGGYLLGGGTVFGRALPGIGTTGGFKFGNIPLNLFGQSVAGGAIPGTQFEGILSKIGLSEGFGGGLKFPGGITGAITAASAVAGALTPDEENQAQQIADSTGFSIEEARNQILAARQDDFRARAFKAGGGLMRLGYQEGGDAEPVAKKTMPLLDMDGKEKDYRETGGFVDMGRMERADDVPARLSKNEFVFTADAVRNAGDGSVDKGAEVMYNMMKNLEAGGEVSEESQGLEGARKMFQTSQRLEEVI